MQVKGSQPGVMGGWLAGGTMGNLGMGLRINFTLSLRPVVKALLELKLCCAQDSL